MGRKKVDDLFYHICQNSHGNGSIFGIPIRHNHLDRIIYVLTVKSSFGSVFSSKTENVYKDVWKVFEDRILLEYSLKEIKSHALQNDLK